MFTSADGSMDLRVSAYAVVTDDAGRVLLPHWSDGGRGGWTLPGGGLDPGEHPADAAVREVHEETGLHVELGALLGVDSIVVAAAERPPGAVRPAQALRIVYRARVTGGALRPEQDGSTDGVAWHTPAEVAALDRVALVDTGLRWAGLLG